MKPYKMFYACPHCGKKLESQNTLAGQTHACPLCEKSFVVPPAPPRPIGGWLTFYGTILLLGTAYGAVLCAMTIILIPLIIPMGIFLYGFFTQRKWFMPISIASSIIGIVLGMLFFDLWAVLVSTVVLGYFWKSRRVRETFVA